MNKKITAHFEKPTLSKAEPIIRKETAEEILKIYQDFLTMEFWEFRLKYVIEETDPDKWGFLELLNYLKSRYLKEASNGTAE